MQILKSTGYISLIIQFITGLIDLWGLTFKVPDSLNIFKELLAIEFVVQIIEFIFYIWFIIQFKNGREDNNLTVYRYYDWFITTPSMLLTLMVYLDTNLDGMTGGPTNVIDFIKINAGTVTVVFILNALMLIFGLSGELGWIDKKKSTIIGFIPFVIYYYIIYKKFVDKKDISNDKKSIFYYFVFFWSLYGIAALQSYEIKNSMYNILDLFAKNFFGLFLVYILYQKSK